MIKKCAVFISTIVVLLSCIPMQVFAAKKENLSAQNVVSNIAVQYCDKTGESSMDSHCQEILENDLANLYSVGLYQEDIALYNFDTDLNEATYQLHYENNITNIVQVNEAANGDLSLNIFEGDLHDEVLFKNDGTLYVNGRPIEYQDSSLIYNSPEEYSLTQTDTLLNKESGKNFATANMRDIIWQSRPFSGYPATAFENNWHLVFPSKTIVFNQIIKSMTTGALVSVIGTRLVSFLSAASVAAATLLIGAGIDVMLSGIAEYYKSVAQRFAPSADSIAVSVKRAALVDPPVLDSYSRYFAAYALPVSTNRFNQERYFYSLNYFT